MQEFFSFFCKKTKLPLHHLLTLIYYHNTMKKILLTLVLALMACGMNAQTNDAWVIPGPISYDNGKLLNANGGVISKELAKAYFNETQYDIFVQSSKKEKTGDVFIQIGAGVAGFGIGWFIGGVIAGEKVSKALKESGIILGASVPFFAIGLPISMNAEKKINGIVEEYNNALHNNPSFRPSLYFGTTPSGIGFALNF